VSLRAKVITYLIVLHLAFAVAIVWAAGGVYTWLFAVEGVALVSLVVGLVLAGRVFRALGLSDEAARLIQEGDFTGRLRLIGDPAVDRLVSAHNTMVDTLRAERVRNQEQQHFLSTIIDTSPSGMVVLDFDGRVSDVNPAASRLLGIGRDAVVGRSLEALHSPLVGSIAALSPAQTAVVGLAGARRVRCHAGTFTDRGFPRRFFVLEELTEEVRQVERAAYEKLIRVMSHEVNNSTTASNSLLESSLVYAVELPPESRSDLEGALRIAIDRSTQLNQFMRRFADVFRLSVPMRESIDLRDLLERLVALTQARTTETVVECGWKSGEPVWARIDRSQFEQACLNVLRNAVEAAGPGGRVTAHLETSVTETAIQIDDTGPGPGTEAAANLFTPFFSTKPQGQGIGLTLVQEVLSAHGFTCTLDRPSGGPTRFTIRIPVE